MTLLDKVKLLCKEKGVSQGRMEKEVGISNGASSKWATSAPGMGTLQKLSVYFGVSTDYLAGNENIDRNEPQLNSRDEKDIAKRLESTLADLENSQDALMFSGEPLDDETRELLKASLENSIRIAKINAKQKYTPNKYKKET